MLQLPLAWILAAGLWGAGCTVVRDLGAARFACESGGTCEGDVAPQDAGPFCGNTTCDPNEACTTCPQDCGACPATCGDHACNGNETCTSCLKDCGACSTWDWPFWKLPPAIKAGGGAGYTLTADTAVDKTTLLEWTRGEAPGAMLWSEANDYCNKLTLAGGGWRLPQRMELMTLVDYGVASGAMADKTAFPNAVPENYWTATRTFIVTVFWMVDFGVGHVATGRSITTKSPWRVRCVR